MDSQIKVSTDLSISETQIPGLFIIKIPVLMDNRGWFKENYQKEKMEALGLPAFDVVQNNFSFNHIRGVTRGFHAEPWEKYISVANGSVFGAWVDLRAGENYGKSFSIEIDPSIAVFVPRGVANAYQTLEDNVTYTYLVNDHWSPGGEYNMVNLFDPSLSIQWPIPKELAIFSKKDANHPYLKLQ